MKYIYSDENGIHFDRYFEYLQSVEQNLSPHVFQFASNLDHYSLESHSSLHDAWLDYAKVTENAFGDRMQNRAVEIELRFLGPFHDKRIFLNYKEVISYELKASELNGGHGDLWIHELRMTDDSNLIHELLFFDGRTFRITCHDIIHREEVYRYK